MTDEEMKAVKEFDAKLKAFKEEKEKQRRTLESELKKHRAEITAICHGFDEALAKLFQLRLSCDYAINECHLWIVKLSQALMQRDIDEKKEGTLGRQLDIAQRQREEAKKALLDFTAEVDEAEQEYRHSVEEDKNMEKNFRKDFQEFEEHFDYLFRHFRRALKQQRSQLDVPRQESLNPFRVYDRDDKSERGGEASMEAELHCPEGLDPSVWERFLEVRTLKISSELRCHRQHAALVELNKFMSRLQKESDHYNQECDRLRNEIDAFNETRYNEDYNLDLLLKLKQGQLEVEQAAVVTDYSDSVLGHRSVLKEVNTRIHTLGGEKIKILKEIKDYRKGILRLDWETKKLFLEADDITFKTREFQLLRVTKNLQETLKGGYDKDRHAEKIKTLERQLEFNEQMHAKRLEEKRRNLEKLLRQIEDMADENDKLDEDLHDLDEAVEEREKLHEIQQAKSKNTVTTEAKKRMQRTVNRRKLLDIAKAQTLDIELLREELVRLRARTFPSFAQLQAQFFAPDDQHTLQ
uniref:Uncharacterized protein n=1 Tax=Palpitomonas bilix TaxID=652834 RepID=A0A7S3CXA9_9EUKA